MVSFGRSMFCTDAEAYYYDYLCGLDAGIPHAVADHIRHCNHCRAQIRQLEAAIAESEAQERPPQGDADVAGTLGLHFAHLGEDITCAKAKSFLPALLVPSLEIRIPTPITVHVDHCRRCAEDLEAIRELELRPEQLVRLSRLYEAIRAGDSQMCRRTRAKTWAFACASFEGIDAEALDHMCVCPRCRRRVYRCREKILAGRQPGDTIPGVGLCSGISMADLFEWVAPYGRAGGSGEQARDGDETIPSHLQACPECIGRMQELHRTIYGIAERVDSGVSTVYTTGSEAAKSGGQVGSLYSGYPIHVEVAHHQPELVATPRPPMARILAPVRRAATNPRFRPLMKAGLLASAVIPLAILLLVSTRSASGLTTAALDRAVKRAENVHVTVYERDIATPTREIWVASGWTMQKDAHQKSLLNVTSYERKAVFSDGTSEDLRLTRDEVEGMKQGIDEFMRLTRLEIPAGQEAQPITRELAGQAEDGSEVYEWISPARSSAGPSPQSMLRAFVHPATGRPGRIELLQKMPEEAQWRKVTTRVFEYPNQEQMERAKKDLFGDR